MMRMLLLILMIAAAFGGGGGSKPIKGPYAVKMTYYDDVKTMDASDRTIRVWHPTDEKLKFPLISYNHGWGGGNLDLLAYDDLLSAIASFGYIIAATAGCNVAGCLSDWASLSGDPPGYAHYYTYQLKVLEWGRMMANTSDAVMSRVDLSPGVGIGGHSMGGQATLFSASYSNASQHDIKTAVLHHPYTHEFPAATVPFIVFTGDEDTLATPKEMAGPIFNTSGANPIRGYVNKHGVNHDEPDITGYNPLLAQFSAAWYKLHLENKTTEHGINFEAMIYGTGKDSLCHGGDGKMVQCVMKR